VKWVAYTFITANNKVFIMGKITLGISACVAGEAVRFNGGSIKMPAILKLLLEEVDIKPFCPEVAAGMLVPREPVHLVEQGGRARVVGSKTQTDYSQAVYAVSEAYIDVLRNEHLCGYILKSKSPSCGVQTAKIYDDKGNVLGKVNGIFSELLQRELMIPVIEVEMLNSPVLADRFLHRVMLADAFQQLPKEGITKAHLTGFYARYKLLLMAYSPQHYRMAGKLLGDMQGELDDIKQQLYKIMFEGFAALSSPGRQTNALMHVQGYFKRYLDGAEKQELSRVIDRYQHGKIPLSVPVTLLEHHLLKHPNQYLEMQNYFKPYSDDYGLRNHL
jgi:uncharacterized protein YbgA (DUF1722 family)/uncharacterized protein YbbK (DUF523 family)